MADSARYAFAAPIENQVCFVCQKEIRDKYSHQFEYKSLKIQWCTHCNSGRSAQLYALMEGEIKHSSEAI